VSPERSRPRDGTRDGTRLTGVRASLMYIGDCPLSTLTPLSDHCFNIIILKQSNVINVLVAVKNTEMSWYHEQSVVLLRPECHYRYQACCSSAIQWRKSNWAPPMFCIGEPNYYILLGSSMTTCQLRKTD